ncbi:MAG: hypothetical protein EPN97_06880 [Alphaproteobacteria bacterium]|nr:MAG: hypothetical protein EPN97_06880 [Alphaproteobacteria bacterium]
MTKKTDIEGGKKAEMYKKTQTAEIVPLHKCPTKQEAQKIIRELAEAGKVSIPPHALRGQKKRDITTMQILHALEKGYVIDDPVTSLQWEGWETTVRSRAAGELLNIGVSLRWVQDIRVITVYIIK